MKIRFAVPAVSGPLRPVNLGSALLCAALVGVAALSGCSAAPSSPLSSSAPEISAITPTEPATSPIITTSMPVSSTAPGATVVDAADYAVDGSPGYYRWAYAHQPLRECSLSPAAHGLPPRITCSAPYPPDSPTIRVDVFTGVPNAIVLTDEGTEPTIVEGGPTVAEDLPAGSRIVIGDLSCTALPDDGITCTSPGARFTVADGTLSVP